MKWVYFIKPVGMSGPVKIGCSRSPDGRRSTLEKWSPFTLEIVAEIEGDFEVERRFHALFADYHERREWFTWHPDIQVVIEAINAGSFDLNSLPAPTCITAGKGSKRFPRTPEQRRQLSYSLRAAHMQSRTGHTFPGRVWGIVYRGNADEIAQLDRYLADPLAHGKLIQASWATARAEAFRRTQNRRAS